MTAAEAPVWVLLGQRTGDNNQLLRLASELDLPFRTIELCYNALHVIPPSMLGPSLASLTAQSRSQIRPPWPQIVLGIGYRSVPAALAIRKMSDGAAKIVRLGNPRVAPDRFDLVITTPQYAVRDGSNVLRLPLGISTAARAEPTTEELAWLAKLPRPHRLLLIGGDTFMWRLPPEAVADAASKLARKRGGSVIAVSSARSSQTVLDSVAHALRRSDHALVWGRLPRYPVLLDDADEIFVTADSVAMVSDAVATNKPLGLIEPELDPLGRLFYGLDRLGFGVPFRDVRRFWTSVLDRGFAGTVDQPTSSKNLAVDPLAGAVEAVRSLLDNQAASASCGSQPR